MNGRISTVLQGFDGRSEEAELAHRLKLLNGERRCSLNMWALPPGVPFDMIDDFPDEYIQCAGDFAGEMICELRGEIDGQMTHCALGRILPVGSTPQLHDVHWSDFISRVPDNEVLSGADVTDLFLAYYRTRTVPATYSRRPLRPDDYEQTRVS